MALPTPLQAFSGVPKINTAPDKQTIVDGEKMTGAQALIRSLEDLGVEDVFGIPGGAILPVYHEIKDNTKFRFVLMRHEQAAGHAAEGYALATGKVGVGILAGYGLRNAAVATSVSHDSHNIVVCGDNDADMLAAVRRVAAMGGGIAVASEGRILEDLPLPVAGLMTHEAPETVVRALDAIHGLLHGHGVPANVAPLRALSFMALPVIPSLKLTARGLFSVADWRFVSVDAAARH